MNILLDGLDFHKDWAYDRFKNIIKPDFKVTVVPFAFHEKWITNYKEWGKFYSKLNGENYDKIINPFLAYGINEDNITWVNYFTDNANSARAKIMDCDIIFFTGGLPDKIMNRLQELNLINEIERHNGIIMGWSAGAMIQCLDYYCSSDEEYYPNFMFLRGLNCVKEFAVEVHYKNTEAQNEGIEKFIHETGKEVYITKPESAIVVDKGKIILLGNARKYQGRDNL